MWEGCKYDNLQASLVLNDFTTHAINPISYDQLLLIVVNYVEVDTTPVNTPYPSLTDYQVTKVRISAFTPRSYNEPEKQSFLVNDTSFSSQLLLFLITYIRAIRVYHKRTYSTITPFSRKEFILSIPHEDCKSSCFLFPNCQKSMG